MILVPKAEEVHAKRIQVRTGNGKAAVTGTAGKNGADTTRQAATPPGPHRPTRRLLPPPPAVAAGDTAMPGPCPHYAAAANWPTVRCCGFPGGQRDQLGQDDHRRKSRSGSASSPFAWRSRRSGAEVTYSPQTAAGAEPDRTTRATGR